VRGFTLQGLTVEAKPKQERTVHSVMLKFTGVLKAVGLSALASQKLSIKVDVDTNPPLGGVVVSTLINREYVFTCVHYDLASLFATKLHACFYRTYLKGRDFYDLIWYVGKRVKPNLMLMNNAIAQSQGSNPRITEDTFKSFLLSNIEKIDLGLAKKDVERFLEDKSELKLFDKKALCQTIESVYL